MGVIRHAQSLPPARQTEVWLRGGYRWFQVVSRGFGRLRCPGTGVGSSDLTIVMPIVVHKVAGHRKQSQDLRTA